MEAVKRCVECSAEMRRREGEAEERFAKRRYCSFECVTRYLAKRRRS